MHLGGLPYYDFGDYVCAIVVLGPLGKFPSKTQPPEASRSCQTVKPFRAS